MWCYCGRQNAPTLPKLSRICECNVIWKSRIKLILKMFYYFNSTGILKNRKGKQRGCMRNKCDDREEEEMIEGQKEGNKNGRQGERNKKTGGRKEGRDQRAL